MSSTPPSRTRSPRAQGLPSSSAGILRGEVEAGPKGRRIISVRRRNPPPQYVDANAVGGSSSQEHPGAVPSTSSALSRMSGATSADEDSRAKRRVVSIREDGVVTSTKGDSATQRRGGGPGDAPKVTIDRMMFSSVNFSASTLVNNITNRLLFPVLLSKKRKQQKPITGSLLSRPRAAGSDTDAMGEGNDETTYTNVARSLAVTLEAAFKEVCRLLEDEQLAVTRSEARCRRVEVREKRKLATIRLGLEATSTRLQDYENRVSNAMAATMGIEQHLSQSNTRVQRGKQISQLVKFFRMFTKLSANDLSGMLKSISKARVEQRAQATAQWASGDVSHYDPQFFGSPSSSSGANGKRAGRRQGSRPPSRGSRSTAGTSNRSDDEEDDMDHEVESVAGDPQSAFTSVVKHHRKANVATRTRNTNSLLRRRGRHNGPLPEGSAASGRGDDASERDPESAEGSKDESDDDGEGSPLTAQKFSAVGSARLNRAEASAIAQGLDRRFAMRGFTESQVEWTQKLLLLSRELVPIVPNAANVDIYSTWLRQELAADCAHLVERFYEFYEEAPDVAEHHVYGRALLKTLELISKLYATLSSTSSTEGLLAVFFKRSINDMGVTLFTEHSLKPLPPQPPLPNPATVLAMQHYHHETKQDLQKTFDFLISRVRRDVIVVEAIFGVTSAARQQLLSQMMEGVVKPFVKQQIQLAKKFSEDTISSEARLSPRSKRRASARVADAISYSHTIQTTLFSFFQKLIDALKGFFGASETEFLGHFVDSMFTERAEYSSSRAELDLLKRYHVLVKEQYTRSLHPMPDDIFSLRDEHMQKTKELLTKLEEVVGRVKIYALPKDVGPYVFDLVKESLENMGRFLDAEVKKTHDSVKADRDSWKLRVKNTDELLHPSKPESQLCGLRMLLFLQSSLMSMSDTITVLSMPLLAVYPRLASDMEETKNAAWEALDERSESLLNLCLQAIITRSLSILLHEQNKNDFSPKEAKWGSSQENDEKYAMVAPPCTRACTLFCLYMTRQFQEAREFILLSNGQVPRRQTAAQIAAGATLGHVVSLSMNVQSPTHPGGTKDHMNTSGSAFVTGMKSGGFSTDASDAVKARAKTMNLQQLLYGDGGPSSVARTLGVCLYRGISAHLRQFLVNDKGALIYKQDVTAYREVMRPLIDTAGLGGAVVDVLFRLLKETSSLLIMPFDHIKEVKNTGLLALMSNEEKVRIMKMRLDMKEGFRQMRK